MANPTAIEMKKKKIRRRNNNNWARTDKKKKNIKEIRRIIDEKIDEFKGEMIKVEWVGQKMPSWIKLKAVQRSRIANLLAEFKNNKEELKKEQKEKKRRRSQRSRNIKKIEEVFKHKEDNGKSTYKVFLGEDEEEDWVEEKHLKDEVLLKFWKKRRNHLLDIYNGVMEDDDEEEIDEERSDEWTYFKELSMRMSKKLEEFEKKHYKPR